MGITAESLEIMHRHKLLEPGLSMLELGCQNLYDQEEWEGRIAAQEFGKKGLRVVSLDK